MGEGSRVPQKVWVLHYVATFTIANGIYDGLTLSVCSEQLNAIWFSTNRRIVNSILFYCLYHNIE